MLDQSGNLTSKALECVTVERNRLVKGQDLGNTAVIKELTKDGSSIGDWAKYKTDKVTLSNGHEADIHFYYNHVTGVVHYDNDFKVKQPTPLFTKARPAQEPKSQPPYKI